MDDFNRTATENTRKESTVRRYVAFGLFGIALTFWLFSLGERDTLDDRPKSSLPPSKPSDNLGIKKFHWNKGGFNTVMLGTFTIRNDNSYAVKDIGVRCRMSAKSGTVIDTVEETIFDTIPAASTKTFSEVSMGFIRSQTSTANCEITGAKVALGG